MNRISTAGLLLALLGGCSVTKPASCPAFSAVAPATIGPDFVARLSEALAGPDRENSIDEAVAEIHRKDPTLDTDTITNILIAADCPNIADPLPTGTQADRERIAKFRAQVDQLLSYPLYY